MQRLMMKVGRVTACWAILFFVTTSVTAQGPRPGPSPGPGPGPGPNPVVGPSPGPAGAKWEVRRMPSGVCHVEKAAAGSNRGARVAGPYPNRKRAEDELRQLRRTPRCK